MLLRHSRPSLVFLGRWPAMRCCRYCSVTGQADATCSSEYNALQCFNPCRAHLNRLGIVMSRMVRTPNHVYMALLAGSPFCLQWKSSPEQGCKVREDTVRPHTQDQTPPNLIENLPFIQQYSARNPWPIFSSNTVCCTI